MGINTQFSSATVRSCTGWPLRHNRNISKVVYSSLTFGKGGTTMGRFSDLTNHSSRSFSVFTIKMFFEIAALAHPSDLLNGSRVHPPWLPHDRQLQRKLPKLGWNGVLQVLEGGEFINAFPCLMKEDSPGGEVGGGTTIIQNTLLQCYRVITMKTRRQKPLSELWSDVEERKATQTEICLY